MSQRLIPVTLPSDLGFFTKNGVHALKVRAIFSKFFYPEKLEIYTPKITNIVDSVLNEYSKSFCSDFQEELPPNYVKTGKNPAQNFFNSYRLGRADRL